MGAFTVLYYAALYPPLEQGQDGGPDLAIKQTPSEQAKTITDDELVERHSTHTNARRSPTTSRHTTTNGSSSAVLPGKPAPYRPSLSGVAVAAPMITISSQSRPNKAVEYIAHVLRFFAGRLPMVTAIKGNVSDDPRVEHEFEADPLTYKGKLRISTGPRHRRGIEDLAKKAHLITCPSPSTTAPTIESPTPTAARCSSKGRHPARTQEHQDLARLRTRYVCPTLLSAEPCARLLTFPLVDDATVMMKHVQGMSEEDTQKTLDVLTEIVSCTCLHCCGRFADFCIGAVLQGDWLVEQARR